MKGNPEVIAQLNGILTNELTAINQYFLHARVLKDWGFLALADYVYKESIGEMNHADWLIERILFLEGLPNVQNMHKIKTGENIDEIFTHDLAVELKNQHDLGEAIKVCERVGDFVSRDLLRRIMDDTEEHVDWIETQQNLIKQVGVQGYLQARMGPVAADAGGEG